MTTPTAADIRSWSKLDFDSLTYSDDSDLQRVLDQAISYVEFVTGRRADPSLPSELEGLMRQALQMRTEQVVYQAQADAIETASDDTLQSFSAGGYSETRHDATRRGESKMLNPWQALNDILWMLMTDDKLDYWNYRLAGLNAPAWSVTEVDWSLRWAGDAAFGDPFPAIGAFGDIPY